jgi:chromosome segregation ATPase
MKRRKEKEERSNADANNMLFQEEMGALKSAHESLISVLYGKSEISEKPKLKDNWTKDELEAIRSEIEREVGELRHNYTEALAENRGLREEITKEKEAKNTAERNAARLGNEVKIMKNGYKSLVDTLPAKLKTLEKRKLQLDWTDDGLQAIRREIEREIRDLRQNYTETLRRNQGLNTEIAKEKEAKNSAQLESGILHAIFAGLICHGVLSK